MQVAVILLFRVGVSNVVYDVPNKRLRFYRSVSQSNSISNSKKLCATLRLTLRDFAVKTLQQRFAKYIAE